MSHQKPEEMAKDAVKSVTGTGGANKELHGILQSLTSSNHALIEKLTTKLDSIDSHTEKSKNLLDKLVKLTG